MVAKFLDEMAMNCCGRLALDIKNEDKIMLAHFPIDVSNGRKVVTA
jgi:hypothetical protein